MSDSLAAPRHLRHRHQRSAVFAACAGGSLMLGLMLVVLLVFATLRESGTLSSMHATARAGLALAQRASSVGEQSPYVAIAQVADGSPASQLGLRQGDALLTIEGSAVTTVQETWARVAALPTDAKPRRVAWASNLESMLGEVEVVPVEGQPGVVRPRLAYVGTDTVAAKAGLLDGDVLLTADGEPLHGSQQSWQTLVIAARTKTTPVQLRIERSGEQRTVAFPVRQEGELSLARDLGAALWRFVTSLDEPRYPEHAGLASAILGSLLVVLVTMVFAFPLGIAAAVYLEEYARKSRLTSVLQVLIANLAGIPSVVYGILGLEIIDRTLGLGRSILTGGLTLGLLILPVMILGCREALRTVPPWVRQAAYAVGATPSQVVWHQVLPYALPGMFTAMILAISRAIGEAAPLILLGAFLFVTYLPNGLMDSFTVVPIQIFTWATRPQAGYETIAAVAILVLLVLMLLLNGTAIVLRNRFQLRW